MKNWHKNEQWFQIQFQIILLIISVVQVRQKDSKNKEQKLNRRTMTDKTELSIYLLTNRSRDITHGNKGI